MSAARGGASLDHRITTGLMKANGSFTRLIEHDVPLSIEIAKKIHHVHPMIDLARIQQSPRNSASAGSYATADTVSQKSKHRTAGKKHGRQRSRVSRRPSHSKRNSRDHALKKRVRTEGNTRQRNSKNSRPHKDERRVSRRRTRRPTARRNKSV